MSEIHLLTAMAQKYAKMTASERIKKIKKLVAKSKANRDFIRKYYPDFYDEAFPTARAARAHLQSTPQPALSARLR